MKNNNRPFFYDEKKTPLGKVILAVFITAAILIFIGCQIPGIRQIISEPLFAFGSFIYNSGKEFISITRMYHEPEQKKKTYTPLDLPDKQVLFAESLENLSAISQEDPLADLRQTPTPSEYSRVAEWEYLDPNLNYEISSGGRSFDEVTVQKLIPPVFERADLFNDGPAILSANLRYWNIVENQYHIAEQIHPDPEDPVTDFDGMVNFIENNYPQFSAVSRVNGDKDILIELLHRNIPVIVLIQAKTSYPFWPKDDRFVGRYLLIHGYDGSKNIFSFQDTFRGNTLEIRSDELLALWYPFQREYLILYPEDKDDDVRSALSENYYPELNIQRALAKFKIDSERLEENPFAQYGCGVMLHKDGDNKGAWEYFEKALALSLPQRYVSYQTDILETAFEMGYADDIDQMITPLLDRNSHDETLNLYRGWAAVLRGDIKRGVSCFEKAGKINPFSESVLYALKYKETMIN